LGIPADTALEMAAIRERALKTYSKSQTGDQETLRQGVFISYSHRDRKWLERLQTILKPLVRTANTYILADTGTAQGSIWREDAERAIQRARVAVLLVSPAFLESEFIAQHELPPLLEAAQEQGLVILWVHLSSCLYDETEIKDYQAAHDIAKPLDSLTLSQQNAALVNVCKKIKTAANPQ
jgi:hypothetical protein